MAMSNNQMVYITAWWLRHHPGKKKHIFLNWGSHPEIQWLKKHFF